MKLLSALFAAASLVWLLSAADPLLAQPVGADEEAEGAGDDVVAVADEESGSEDEFSLDELLADEELAIEGYTYDPAGRRDPFKSLLASRQGPLLRGPRPEGIPGLLIDEIDLTGIFLTQEGPVAQFRSTQQEKSFLIREGDQLYDGDVVSISREEVVFRQIVDDPAAIKPFREIVKELRP